MTNLKKRLSTLLLVLSTPLAISNINGVSAGVASSIELAERGLASSPKATLPKSCLEEINRIRKEFIKILACDSKIPIQDKRATIVIVPFSAAPETPLSPRSLAAASAATLPEASKDKIGHMLGYTPAANEIYVPCANLKMRIMKLISNKRYSNAQRLEILKLFCEPCENGKVLIEGNINALTTLDASNVKKIEASLDTAMNGTLSIICHRYSGDMLLFFI